MTSAPSQQGAVLHRLCPLCDTEIVEDRTTCATCGSKLVEIRAEVDTLVGTVVDGRFEIRAKLGQGGMGTVYRAWQKSVGREIAVKLMDRSFSRDAMAVRRFLREARLASQLSQPNTVSVFDFGQVEDGRLFIAMELIRGRTLHELVQSHGAFSIERTVRIGVQICDALEAAHTIGIVHRDLKLENVIVLDHPPGRDLLKVLDFGLAKNFHEPGSRATESGIVVGTPRYMAPEASTTGVTGPASDMYGLGVILGELATGLPLWQGETLPELISQKLSPKPIIARIPAPLRGVLEMLLDPHPERRPTAEQARVLLSGVTVTEPTAADTVRDADPSATTNLRSKSPAPEATRALTVGELGEAPTATPLPVARTPQRAAAAAPSTSFGELDHPPVRRWPLVVVGLGVVAAISITIVLASRGDEEPSSGRTAAVPLDAAPVALVTPDAALPPEPPDAGVVTAPSTVTLRVDSEPRGAMITYRGKATKAPFDLVVDRGTVAIELRGSMPGRLSRMLSVVPDADKAVRVKLPAKPKRDVNSDEAAPF